MDPDDAESPRLSVTEDSVQDDEQVRAQDAANAANVVLLELIPPEPEILECPKMCAACDLPDAKFSCSTCHRVNYCSQSCQRKHWRIHKRLCGSESILDRPVRPSPAEFTFGRSHLGEGNYSNISVCEHTATGEQFAIKTIEKSKVKRVKYRHKDVEREIMMEKDVLKGCKHPMIVKLHHTMQDQFYLYYLLESVRGGELWEKMRNERTEEVVGLYPSQVVYLIAQVVTVLEYLHSQGVVHRDLKPENIMLTQAGHVKLIDFGTAKNLRNGKYNGSEFKGTPEYMSPESVNSEPVGTAADLWALGCLIYQCYLGASPFKAGSPYLSFQRILRRSYDLPEFLEPQARDLINRLLQKDPAKRLGYGPNGYHLLKAHPFFSGVNWKNLLHMSLPNPSTYDLNIERIAKDVIEGTISTIVHYPTNLQNAIKLYLYRYRQLSKLSIHRAFFEDAFEARFHITRNHLFYGHEHYGNSIWQEKPFAVVAIAGPSVGVPRNDAAYSSFIAAMNSLKPAAVVVLGPFTFAGCEEANFDTQVVLFKQLTSELSDSIHLLIVPSGHDIGATAESRQQYLHSFGNDYYQFWLSGMNAYCLNSSLLLSGCLSPAMEEQRDWLEEEMFISKIGSHHLLLFSEHSFAPEGTQRLHEGEHTLSYGTIVARSGVQLGVFSESEEDSIKTLHYHDLPVEKEDADARSDDREYRFANLGPFPLQQTVLLLRIWEDKLEPQFLPLSELGIEIDFSRSDEEDECDASEECGQGSPKAAPLEE